MLSSVVWDCVLWYLKFQTSCSWNMTTNKLAGEVFLYSIKSKQSPKVMKLVEIPWYYVELWYKFEKVPWKLSHMMLRNQDISTCDILYVKYMMIPWWCHAYPYCWAMIVDKWCAPEWVEMHNAACERCLMISNHLAPECSTPSRHPQPRQIPTSMCT